MHQLCRTRTQSEEIFTPLAESNDMHFWHDAASTAVTRPHCTVRDSATSQHYQVLRIVHTWRGVRLRGCSVNRLEGCGSGTRQSLPSQRGCASNVAAYAFHHVLRMLWPLPLPLPAARRVTPGCANRQHASGPQLIRPDVDPAAPSRRHAVAREFLARPPRGGVAAAASSG